MQIRNARWAVGVAMLSLVAASCGGVGQASGEVKLRTSVLVPPNGSIPDTVAWFMDELEKRTDGEVKTDIVYGGGLLSGTDTLPGLKDGRAEAGVIVPAYFPAEMPLNNLNMVPISVADQSARARALQDLVESNDQFGAEVTDNGFVLIGYLPSASSTVSFTDPVNSLDDLDGVKLRTPSKPQAEAWKALGVEPTFMASEEVYESVERGIIDGAAYPMDTQVATGVAEVAQIVAPDVGQSNGAMLAISKTAYDRLSDSAKDAIADLQEEWYDKADEFVVKYEESACKELKASGGTVRLWTDEEKRTIDAAAAGGVDVWKDEAVRAGANKSEVDEVWSQFEEQIDTHTGESGYKDGMLTCGGQTP